MDRTPEDLLDVCRRAAQAGAEQLLLWKGRISPQFKGPCDLVTEADLAAEQAVFDVIRSHFPQDVLVGEESGHREECREIGAAPRENVHLAGGLKSPPGPGTQDDDSYHWVVDPLDGTTNFVHGLRPFAVSVAVVRRSAPLAGVVLDPIALECFEASRGGGARLNGTAIQPSGCRELDRALVAFSLPAVVTPNTPELRQMIEMVQRVHSMRRTGSSALNLCYVASGRLDAFWSTTSQAWDIAAGAVIVQEAGAVIGAIDGGTVDLDQPRILAAATEPLWTHAQRVLSQVPG